ncbi:hypothetical protein ACFLSJ_04575 [Verrucomicrobiota bacterium]
MRGTTMEVPPPASLGAVLDKATGADRLRSEIKRLERENVALRERIAELERRR